MKTSQLQQITYLFPNASAEARAFFDAIAHLLAQASGADRKTERVTLTPQARRKSCSSRRSFSR